MKMEARRVSYRSHPVLSLLVGVPAPQSAVALLTQSYVAVSLNVMQAGATMLPALHPLQCRPAPTSESGYIPILRGSFGSKSNGLSYRDL